VKKPAPFVLKGSLPKHLEEEIEEILAD